MARFGPFPGSWDAGGPRSSSESPESDSLLQILREEFRAVLGLPDPPSPDAGLFDLGGDSVDVEELRRRLNDRLAGSHRVSATDLFDYPTARALADRMARRDPNWQGSPGASSRRGRTEEPVAVVGMACRFPGGADLEGFWTLLAAGGDGVQEGEPGSGQGRLGELFKRARPAPDPRRFGALLERLDRFDAAFFGIPAAEARLMDPQQRLLLEVSWHALEHAGIPPGTLSGTRSAVFAGIGDSGYRELIPPEQAASIYAATGNNASTAIGRIAHTLGLEGPALAVETASSSSLVAVHQAVAALQRGEADLAIAGGVNAIASPARTEMFVNGGMLSPDGRCRSFAAAANGYVRGEGCGMVVLKPLSLAQSAGDRILAVIRGSAVNHDGASAGLTVPRGPAQERLIEEALERAGIESVAVDYLEGHGSGTPLGDPIEVQAALRVYRTRRSAERPLLLGSVKTNVGHLEAAAGVAGFIKVVLAMEAGVIPGQLHFDEPNPRVPWNELPVRVVTMSTRWPRRRTHPPRAGVSSFGLSGTNAHVILEGYPKRKEGGKAAAIPRAKRLLPLSAKNGTALRALATGYQGWLDRRERASLADMAWTAGVGRDHFGQRAGVVFRNRSELRAGLRRVANAAAPTDSTAREPLAGFLFTGQGSHWVGMGRSLHRREPVAREVMERCESVFREERGTSLLEVMFGSNKPPCDLGATEWTQPALYALGSALSALWASVGIQPAAVMGHGVGEIAAAQTAGGFGLEEGMRFATRRGALMGSLPAEGAMTAVFAPLERVSVAIREEHAVAGAAGLEVAADNGTHQVVSGPEGLVASLEGRFAEKGVRAVRLSTSHGFHSALMDSVLPQVEEAAETLAAKAPAVALVSNLRGRVFGTGEAPEPAYWRRQAREPVRFAEGIRELARLGVTVLVELGPRALLGPMASACWPSGEPQPPVIASLGGRPGKGMVEAVAAAYESGLPVRFEGLFTGERRTRITVPAYPFAVERHWVDGSQVEGTEAFDGSAAVSAGPGRGPLSALREVPESVRESLLTDFLREEARELLRLPTPPAADVGFFELGLDSLMVVELRNRLNRELRGEIEVTEAQVFAYPNASRLAHYLARELGGVVPQKREIRAPVSPRRREDERIAVVGMACRFPGEPGVEAFWKQLLGGSDWVTKGRPGGPLSEMEGERFGGYVEGLDCFDAEFFRIAPVEAQAMDPQQRLLLETSWEALEDAGIAPEELRGSQTGVYSGMFTSDYRDLASAGTRGLYRSTGSSFSAAIGRVAYTLGLEGPAIAVDTACSSSLVALHQAVGGLERGDADLALAGGVNAILSEELSEAFAEAGMLAPDGRCKTFDASADGYVRGEGCGMVVLKRLSDAEASGDRILGVLLGSAVNQDGASAGLTVPNGPAQERVIEEALARAGLEPSEVDYLEAHGTGTGLGDPIEVEAAAAVYGRDRDPERPLLLGSVKTNIGHLEAAAGVAGLIKAVLAMRSGVIPKHLHFERPNPRMDWDRLPVRVTSEATPWPEVGRPRRAAVSSFGYSGTNAHVVLEGYAEDRQVAEEVGREFRLLPLSGKTSGALSELAGRYRSWLTAESRLADMAWTAGVGRSHFGHRAGVVFRDLDSLREQLEFVEERGFRERGAGSGEGKVAFLYTGQGSQWAGMGRELYEGEPVAREVLERCEEAFREERGESLLAVMFGESEGLERTEWTQPALYALESALTSLWASVGVRPEVVFGHSVGEIAAAGAAGVFDLEGGLRFAARRGALMGSLPAGGAMAAVFASVGRVTEALPGSLSLAAENGSHQVVSGPEEELAGLLAEFEASGVRVERLLTSHAFHSALLAPVLAELEGAVGEVSAPSVPLVSGVSGRLLSGAPEGAYWRRQAREAVRFGTAVETLCELGVGLVVEVGPHAVLGPLASLAWPGSAGPAVVSSLRRAGSGAFVTAVAGAYEAGLDISFGGLFAGEERRRVSVPTYPFQRERHWVESARRGRGERGHPLLGVRRDVRGGGSSFETELYGVDPGWLGEHRVFGEVVAPGALYAAQAIAALGETGAGAAVALTDVQIHRPLVLSGDAGRTVQVVLGSGGGFEVVSRESGAAAEWALHAEGVLGSGGGGGEGKDLEGLKGRLAPVDTRDLYRRLAAGGLAYGRVFQALAALWSGSDESLAEVALPAELEREGLLVHPALLDGCFQVLSGVSELAEGSGVWLPFGWDRLWLNGPLPGRLVCHARVREGAGETRKADLGLYATGGEALGGVEGFTLRRASRSALLGSRLEDLLYEVVWREVPGVGVRSAEFVAGPEVLASGARAVEEYLSAEGVSREGVVGLGRELERESRWHVLRAFEELGWERVSGERFEAEALRRGLKVTGDHGRLFGRLLVLLEEAGLVSRESGGGWLVRMGREDALPEGLRAPEEPAASIEQALLRRCGGSLSEVLRGRTDPLELLFGGEPGAADLYRESQVGRAVNRMVGDAVSAGVGELPAGRRLRVLEVGAGTGATTASVLPGLPGGRTDYEFTDISAGFFAAAESRFGDSGADMRYRVLDIERDPAGQGFAGHGYDLVIAANVLHATRDLGEALGHCRRLLAPSGLLVAVEGTAPLGFLDLTFGLLPDRWRFDDGYRPEHALVGPEVWRRALGDAGFGEVSFRGVERGQVLILARGPAEVEPAPGLFVVAGGGEFAAALERELTNRKQRVEFGPSAGADRESWRCFFEGLPGEVPLRGVAHLEGVRGDGSGLSTGELAAEVELVGSSALALVQGMADAGISPADGVWFVTRGAQVVDRERSGALSGASLWGFSGVVGLEHPALSPRLLDLDPEETPSAAVVAEELLFPDRETRIARRGEERRVARLARLVRQPVLPERGGWRLAPDPGGALDALRVEETPLAAPGPGEIRVAVEAAGVNFHDVMVAMRVVDVDHPLGGEMCGRVVEVGPEVAGIAVGERVVGFAAGTFGPEVVTRAELVVPAPPELSPADVATVPAAFVTAALAFEFAELSAGALVLIHAGTGGVGQAAIRLARAAGLRVLATASAPKQEYLRSLGVEGVFESRDPGFGDAVLEATGGGGVALVLNSLTGEGFIEAGLSCLARGGYFVELGKRGIWSEDEMAAARPDVKYRVLGVDRLVAEEPERVGTVLGAVMARVGSGELEPLPLTRWPLSQAGGALSHMREARHLGKLVLTPSPLASGHLREDRSYLVTGGLGGIGLEVAGWLADAGAGVIVLNGRRAPDGRAETAIKALRERGVEVRVEIADVTDEQAVEGMLSRIDTELLPLAGVVHSVGVLSDGALTNLDWGRFERVLGPKVLGAWRLHRATLDRDLDLFVMFSSAAGVLGNPGQANYAAANAFLDQLARHRRALGLAGQAIAWGAWSGVGEAEEARERIAGRLAQYGEGWIAPRRGLEALSRLVRQDVGTSVVVSADWSALPSWPPLLEAILGTEEGAAAAPAPVSPVPRLRDALPGERNKLMTAFLRGEIRSVLRLSSIPDPDVGFAALGMDSLMAVSLRDRLNRALPDAEMSHTAMFDFPNVTRLAEHLVSEMFPQEEPEPMPAPVVRKAMAAQEESGIAVVGMAGWLPGGPHLPAFWEMLKDGREAITQGRPQDLSGSAGPSHWGAYVPGLDSLDAGFFGISRAEAQYMDPQQRMLLEVSWTALEDAGVDPRSLKGSRTGIYAGVALSEYGVLISESGKTPVQLYQYLGNSPSASVNRVSYFLGLAGPALAVETACSSSLVAAHYAVAGLQRNEVDLALAGGVNTILRTASFEAYREAGILSPDGRCRAFDASANGFGRGEGCGVLVLKRLRDAEVAGDNILAVLTGTAVGQAGVTSGLTVPNRLAQHRVLLEAVSRSGIHPADLDYLEAHGGGSLLGDPIEIEAAAGVYGPGRHPDRPLMIGSVKSNVSNMESAGGVAAMIKVIQSMGHGWIPRHLHFEEPNPRVKWEELAVRVTSEGTDWPIHPDRPRRAGVSSFGFSGTIAHVVMEEYRAPERPAAIRVPPPPGLISEDATAPVGRQVRLVPLAGKTGAALRALAERYRSWLPGGLGEAVSEVEVLADLAWTAGEGRHHLVWRAGLVAADAESLAGSLELVSEGTKGVRSRTPDKTAFLFGGVPRGGMGRELYDSEPVVRATLDLCERVFREERGASLLGTMFEGDGAPGEPEWKEPTLVALGGALAALWNSVGIRPEVVAGWDGGAVAAASAAGVLPLEDAMRLAARRSGRPGSAPPGAAEADLADLRVASPSLPLLDAKTGEMMGPLAPGPRYWIQADETPGAVERMLRNLAAAGVDSLVEAGPPTLFGTAVSEAFGRRAPRILSSPLTPEGGEGALFTEAVAAAYEAGFDLSFAGLFTGERRRRLRIPTYPFQRERHWFT